MQGSFIAPGPATTLFKNEDDKNKASITEMFKETKGLKRNLLCSVMVWMHGSFNFYLITFYLKYFPGNIYVNSMCFASADFIAYMMSGMVLKKF
jgi:hypothetical protein